MSVPEPLSVPTSLSPFDLPLLTLQLLAQLQYDRNIVKSYYESCKLDLHLQQQKCVKETARWRETTEELRGDIVNLSIKAEGAMEMKIDLELQLDMMKVQFKLAQERIEELEAAIVQKDQILEKLKQGTSEQVSQVWAGIQRVELLSEASKRSLLESKEDLAGRVAQLSKMLSEQIMLHEEQAKVKDESNQRLLAEIQQLTEIVHNTSQLHENKDTAEKRVQELLDRINSLEKKSEEKSTLIKTFWKHLQSFASLQESILKQHSEIRTVLKHQKSQIVDVQKELPSIFHNFSTGSQRYRAELRQQQLKKILNGKNKEEVLLEAAKAGKNDDISLLLGFDVDTEARDSSGKTALHLAAEHGHLKACEALLDGGSRIEAVATSFEGNTPIYIAAWKGHLDIVRLFADRGAKLSAKNRNGATPLKVAKVWNHHNVAKFLEERGATM